jgi:hypothetical protein
VLYKWAEPEIVLQFFFVFAWRCNVNSSLVKSVKGIVFHVRTITMAADGGPLKVGKETSMTFLLALYRLFPKGNRMARTYPRDLLTLEISDMKFTCHVQIYYHMWTWSGFGGLQVACWPLIPKFAGSNPAKAIGFLRAK